MAAWLRDIPIRSLPKKAYRIYYIVPYIVPWQKGNRDTVAQKKQSWDIEGYSYLQSKQGEPIPDSIGTKRFSSYAVLLNSNKKMIDTKVSSRQRPDARDATLAIMMCYD